MGQLVLSAGRQLGRFAARWAAGAAVRAILPGPDTAGPRLPEIPIQTSIDGAPMPRLWGRARLAGQVIWAARYREHATTSQSGGKGGGPEHTDYTYSLSFAVGLCEGEISGIGRVWANGALLDRSAYVFRVHAGGEDQLPDALIESIEGTAAPAFRGTAYVVFEDLPLDEFGHRIPNLSFEVFRRQPGGLETQVRGVNLIPGSGEFAYHPDTVMRVLGPGREEAENRNNGRGLPDFMAALDDLERELPNCRSVQLIVSWFGDDLRCGDCRIRPGVESRDKQTRDAVWSVAATDRQSACLVSQQDGRPVYGGTPDDAAVVAAIRELKARGYAVTLYPFILMDVPPDNDLPDPYGGAEQAVFPWRGRITCHPAPGQAGTVDQGAPADSQVSAFFGTASAADFPPAGGTVSYAGPAEWRYRRFILHYAALARAAGGVDGFLIGSEMAALTIVRSASGYPAVDQLVELAAEARAVLGPATRLSYAADWTEYSGHQPGGGEKIFHLDPLWSHPVIDAVAIDWYVPLADWRDGPHLDEAIAAGPHDPDYLTSNMAGGEGHDWYYASPADRDAQLRTPIADAAHGEDWVWRYKDLAGWWGHAHHDRPGGVRSATATGWVPGMKPVWLTEVGCPAVDRGANQPNVFVDPKSAESAVPRYSHGTRDDLVQRRYLEVMTGFWSEPVNNPVSPVYGGAMVDPGLVHAWAWDARPWPDFPARDAVWADGENWRLGHWLNGRTGLVPARDVISSVCSACGLEAIDTAAVDDLVAGYVIDRPMSGRAALEPLMEVLGITAGDRAASLRFASAGAETAILPLTDPVAGDPADQIERASPFDLPGDVQLAFIDDTADYQPAAVSAQGEHTTVATHRMTAPLLAGPDLARRLCSGLLDTLETQQIRWRFGLPPSHLALEAGDRVSWQGETLQIAATTGMAARECELVRPSAGEAILAGSAAGTGAADPVVAVRPVLAWLDLPALGETARTGPLAAVFRSPSAGAMDLHVDAGNGFSRRAGAAASSTMGVLAADLPAAARGRWSDAPAMEVELYGGVLESRSRLDVLNGVNSAAIEQPGGGWEIIQFARAELVGERRYRLSDLLRGQTGETVALEEGARFVLLDHRLTEVPLQSFETGLDLVLRAVEVGRSANGPDFAQTQSRIERRDLWPLAPVHLRSRRSASGATLSWIRCAARGGDDWLATDIPLGFLAERYRVEVLEAEEVMLEKSVTAAACEFTDDALIAVFGALPESLDVRICQLDDRGHPGFPVRRTLIL